MKKKKKLNLESLKVESFVTQLDGKEDKTIKGGATVLYGQYTCGEPTTVTVDQYKSDPVSWCCDTDHRQCTIVILGTAGCHCQLHDQSPYVKG